MVINDSCFDGYRYVFFKFYLKEEVVVLVVGSVIGR